MDASESKSAAEEGGGGGGGSVGALPKAANRNPNQEEEGEGRGRGQGRGEGEEVEVEVEEGGGGGRERNPNGRKGLSFAERLAARSNGSSNSNNNSNSSSNSNSNSNAGRSSSIARFKIIPRSNCLTIPPGLSPATLLDSPVLLSSPATGQAEPSPTTGTFPLPPIMPRNSTSPEDSSPGFAFKPFPNSGVNSVPTFANLGAFGFSHQQALAHLQAQAPSPAPLLPCQRQAPASVPPHLVALLSVVAPQPEPLLLSSPPPPPEKPISPVIMERPSDDGFNWRKYGQKQVKGSEFPRSYYKCTFPSCPVKKKVECSADGQVTEIVYKGEHNHPKPLVTRRVSIGTATTNTITTNNNSSDPSSREGPHNKGEMDSRTGRIVDPLSSSKGQLVPYTGGASGADEQSSGSVSDDDGEDGDDEEPDSKRRKEDKGHENVAITPLRTIREPRVVVQTTSEVDILDDGYRWRKYGQKVVKGNPHPRSYYKCTNLGCSVRKHVERSSTDAKAVITTYEGKHNHDVPAARNGGTHDAGGGSTSSARQTILATGTNASAIKPPSQPPLHDQYFYEKPSDGRSSIALLPSSSFPPPNSSFHQGVPQRVVLGP